MSGTELGEMGPVDYLCVEFPEGSLNGTALPLLMDLVDRQIIRVLDILFVRKEHGGGVTAFEHKEIDVSGFGVFQGAASGMLGGDDFRDIAGVLEEGSAAVILVYENLWAAPLATTLRHNGAHLVAGGRIPVQALMAALDETEEAAEASLQGR
ncbi:hypothetical protein FHR83_002154 [Actinoplanes campanulatus]|uniref:DUF1269 domain-containing protein n=1 Tax=Actinoplanes campanulatus TaxID=113559 RepID=A0A7W5ADT8_9ACTN|nr:DUF6325 family protein [Actinoplanes campanulatus]MBB3094502.1 hypothetical protein [Actinoplanes campanulatus]GGN21501.1 hypothetical protein GCM10010109_35670 [Actinoplanes campanulatus]GID35583.1 hypothetical protein Aca09nite_20890 [Actinoplanes campanulatus]